MSNRSTRANRSASLWRKGKNQFETGKIEDATISFMKGYYLFPDEQYAHKNLIGAKASYSKRNMKKELSVVENILKSYDIKNEKSTTNTNKKINISKNNNK